jgi:hypothetical protein
MRKFMILAASLAALVVPTAAMAAVTYDDAGFGSVGKGDVQTVLGWNDAELQDAEDVEFTRKQVGVFDYSWNCPNDGTQHFIYTITTIQPLDVTELANKFDKVTGWTLNGRSTTDPAYSTIETTGPAFFTCPSGGYGDFTTFKINPTGSSIVQVNDVDLPETPVEVPAV